MKIGLLQQNYTIGDFLGNSAKIKQQILNSKQNVDIFITPEMSLWGYPPQDLLLIEEYVTSCYKILEKLCAELSNYCFLVGLATKCKESKKLFNSMALCYSGKIQKLFHKCLLPNYDVFDEKRYFKSFNECDFFVWKDKKIGVCICEDLCYQKTYNLVQNHSQQHLIRLKNNKIDFIFNPSCSPYAKNKIEKREFFLRETANKFNCPIIFINQVGGNDSLIFDGSSFVTDKEKILCKLKSFKEESYIFEKNNQKKAITPNLEQEIIEALVLGLKDYFYKTGFTKALVGLSGGIDSALTIFLAVKALGNKNVTAIIMPSPYSSNHSLEDANLLCSKLNIKNHNIPIKNLMGSYSSSLKKLFTDMKENTTEENIQTRIRGTLLMAIANKGNQLLLTTGNKSELFTGYCTLYGDMCGALNPIGDLTKTEVYTICKYINLKKEIIPNNILTKEPSAELKPNQVDQDSLPPYELLDNLLEKAILFDNREKKLLKNFNKELIQKSLKLFNYSEYKRQQAPLILRISNKAFGIGWRMPVAKKITY